MCTALAGGCRQQDYRVIAVFHNEEQPASPVYALKGNAIVRPVRGGLEVIYRNGDKKRLPLPANARLDMSPFSAVSSDNTSVLYRLSREAGPEIHERRTDLFRIDIVTGKAALLRTFPGRITSAKFSWDASALVIVTVEWAKSDAGERAETVLSCYDTRTDEWRELLRIRSKVTLCNWSQDNTDIYVVTEKVLTANSWAAVLSGISVRDGRQHALPVKFDDDALYFGLVVLPSEQGVVYGSPDGSVLRTDVGRKANKLLVEVGDGRPYPIQIDPSGKRIVAGFERLKDGDRPVVGMGFVVADLATSDTALYEVGVKNRYPDFHFLQWHPSEPRFITRYETQEGVEIREYTVQ
jgi:hypothetical protein